MSRHLKNVTVAWVLIVAGFVVHSVYLSCIAEDAYISFRFARNLATGNGLVWNIGEPPIEGYTNFLWIVLCAGALKVGLDLVLVVQLVGIASAIGVLFCTWRFASKFLGFGAFAAFVPVVLLAASGPLATWASSGMETTAFGLLICASFYQFVDYWTSGSRRAPLFAGLSALLATLLRPEGLLFFGLLIGMSCLYSRQRSWVRRLAEHAIPILVYSLPLAVYVAWKLAYFGSWIPNTYFAKTGGGIFQYLRGVQYLTYFSIYYLLPLLLASVLIFWAAGVRLRNLWFDDSSVASLLRKNVGLSACCIVSTGYIAYVVYVGGDYMAMYRFLVPVLPLIYLIFGVIIEASARKPAQLGLRRVVWIGAVVLAVGGTVIHSTPLEGELFPPPRRQHGHFRGVQAERWHVARLTEIGRFFESYKSSSDASLATRAIGAIGFHADMKIHDLTGLIDRKIAHLDVPNLGLGWAGHEKIDLEYSLGRKPTYIMFDRHFPEAAEGLPAADDVTVDLAGLVQRNYPRARRFVESIRNNKAFVQDHYKLMSVWMIDEANGEEGYFSFLELRGDD